MNLVFANHEIVRAFYPYGQEEQIRCVRHTNEVIGVYVIAGARLRLYCCLERLQELAFYCDTDCVIYIQN